MNIDIKKDYKEKIAPKLLKQFSYKNVNMIPKLKKNNSQYLYWL